MNNIERINVLYPEQTGDSESEKIWLKAENFIQNNPVEFSEDEESQLMDSYSQLESQGLNGVVHIIHQGSATGEMVARELPSSFKEKYYHRLHIIKAENRESQSGFVREGDTVVYISQDGSIDKENKEMLEDTLKDRVGIISGGGDGSPKDRIYIPLLNALEREIESNTPSAGICLGHQLYGELILSMRNKATEGTMPGYLEGVTSMERITNNGKENPIFSRLGERVNIVSLNMFHLVMPKGTESGQDVFPHGKVLTRSEATEYPTSLELRGVEEGQIITTQRHPEVGMWGFGEDVIFKDEIINLPSGSKLVVPAGSHPDMIKFAKYFTPKPILEFLGQKYGITEEDIQNMFVKERMTKHLGKDFYGPMLNYLADYRFKFNK